MRDIVLALLLMGAAYYYYQQWQESAADEQSRAARHTLQIQSQSRAQSASKKTNPDIPDEAWLSYEDAKDAVYNRDYERAEQDFQNALRLKPDFTEAWYNLGATQANHAIAMINDSEHAAAEKFREAVESKKKARDLMMADKWFVYEGDERTEVRYDVEQALEYADELVANESHLVEALHMWASR